MKKLIALLLPVLLMFTLSGCQTGNETAKSGKIKIGIAAPDVTHGWVAGVAYYAEKYCKEHDITYKITTSTDAAEIAANLSDLAA